jgi:hypothetical protein
MEAGWESGKLAERKRKWKEDVIGQCHCRGMPGRDMLWHVPMARIREIILKR